MVGGCSEDPPGPQVGRGHLPRQFEPKLLRGVRSRADKSVAGRHPIAHVSLTSRRGSCRPTLCRDTLAYSRGGNACGTNQLHACNSEAARSRPPGAAGEYRLIHRQGFWRPYHVAWCTMDSASPQQCVHTVLNFQRTPRPAKNSRLIDQEQPRQAGDSRTVGPELSGAVVVRHVDFRPGQAERLDQ